MSDHLIHIVTNAHGDTVTKKKFLDRIGNGHITRSEHPTSHLCVYFAAYDPDALCVFIGHHKKSDLWLFNGGHMDPEETPRDTVVREAHEEWGVTITRTQIPDPELITLTKIEHPEKQICQWHFDFWHFLPFDRNAFHPKDESLATEFHTWGWKSFDEAAHLLTSQPTLTALDYLKNRR